MTDEAVRAELERSKLHELWDECLRREPEYEDSFISDILDALRLLAGSQQALGEIAAKRPLEYHDDTHYFHPCRRCKELIELARKHWKGGSNDRRKTVQR